MLLSYQRKLGYIGLLLSNMYIQSIDKQYRFINTDQFSNKSTTTEYKGNYIIVGYPYFLNFLYVIDA